MTHFFSAMPLFVALCTFALCAFTGTAQAENSGFLTDYSVLEAQTSTAGTDRLYVTPDGESRLAEYTAIMVDQPEIHFSPDSQYKGLKPADVAAIAAILHDNLVEFLTKADYAIVAEPGPNVLWVRTALTDLYLKKKKRPIYSFTPMGAAVKVGTDAIKETLDKVDIIEMALEAELSDSQSHEILGAAELDRGHRKAKGQKETRMDLDELRSTVRGYGARFACRIENSRLAMEKRVNCLDPAIMEAATNDG